MRGGGRGWWPAAILCGLALVALTLAVQTSWGPLATLDQTINTRLYVFGAAHGTWTAVWKVITHAGASAFGLLVWLVAVVVLVRLGRQRDALAVSLAVLASQLVFRALRLLVYRPRPPAFFVQVEPPSFPSGHTMAAATGAILLTILIWPAARRAWSRVALVTGMIAWAGLVGVSRAVLCVHWPSDVVGGWLCAVALVPPAYALATAVTAARRKD
ncbi:phosphatase PAP2 family protein [Luedemannella helvata]|uniref:Phosphatase PAP2 family protein n=1 Tax=Luedemannella helvata TaxID=349315 RepID=A0ABN2L4U1_9ACTN